MDRYGLIFAPEIRASTILQVWQEKVRERKLRLLPAGIKWAFNVSQNFVKRYIYGLHRRRLKFHRDVKKAFFRIRDLRRRCSERRSDALFLFLYEASRASASLNTRESE